MGDRSRRNRRTDRGARNAPLPEFGISTAEQLAAMEAEQSASPDPHPDRPKGRLLAVDYGTVRVGLAISDHDRRMASPLDNYTRISVETDGDYFRKLARREQAVGLVVGLPIHMDGSENRESEGARAYARWLTELTGLPAVMWDERLSSFAADELMAGAELTRKEQKGKRDKLAAMLILKAYMDAGCPSGET